MSFVWSRPRPTTFPRCVARQAIDKAAVVAAAAEVGFEAALTCCAVSDEEDEEGFCASHFCVCRVFASTRRRPSRVTLLCRRLRGPGLEICSVGFGRARGGSTAVRKPEPYSSAALGVIIHKKVKTLSECVRRFWGDVSVKIRSN